MRKVTDLPETLDEALEVLRRHGFPSWTRERYDEAIAYNHHRLAKMAEAEFYHIGCSGPVGLWHAWRIIADDAKTNPRRGICPKVFA